MTVRAGFRFFDGDKTQCLAIANMGSSWDTKQLSFEGCIRRLYYYRTMMPPEAELKATAETHINEMGVYVHVDPITREPLFVIIPIEESK